MRVLETMWHEYEVNRSSSLRIAGPSDSDDTSSSSSSYFMYKLYSGSTKMSKALGTCWETKDLGQSTASGNAHVSHEMRKIGRKIGNQFEKC